MDNATAKTLERCRHRIEVFETPDDVLKRWSIDLRDGERLVVSCPVVRVSRHEAMLRLLCDRLVLEEAVQTPVMVVRNQEDEPVVERRSWRYPMFAGDHITLSYDMTIEEHGDTILPKERCR